MAHPRPGLPFGGPLSVYPDQDLIRTVSQLARLDLQFSSRPIPFFCFFHITILFNTIQTLPTQDALLSLFLLGPLPALGFSFALEASCRHVTCVAPVDARQQHPFFFSSPRI